MKILLLNVHKIINLRYPTYVNPFLIFLLITKIECWPVFKQDRNLGYQNWNHNFKRPLQQISLGCHSHCTLSVVEFDSGASRASLKASQRYSASLSEGSRVTSKSDTEDPDSSRVPAWSCWSPLYHRRVASGLPPVLTHVSLRGSPCFRGRIPS